MRHLIVVLALALGSCAVGRAARPRFEVSFVDGSQHTSDLWVCRMSDESEPGEPKFDCADFALVIAPLLDSCRAAAQACEKTAADCPAGQTCL